MSNFITFTRRFALIAAAGLATDAAFVGAFARGRQDPASDFARRHRGLVRAGLDRAADRDGICLRRRRHPGPGRQGRRRQHGRRHARRGFGRSGFQYVPRTARPPRHRTELLFDAGLFPRQPAHAQGQQGRGVRPVADVADLAAFRQRRCRADPLAGDLEPQARDQQSFRACGPQVPGIGLWRPSLRPAGQRHPGKRAEDRNRRSEGLFPSCAGQGYAEDRRGRRRRSGHARRTARQDLRRLAAPRPA